MQRILLCILLFISPHVFAVESPDESEEKAKWDVNSDQYHSQEISVDTTTTTWSNVAVSPDGKTMLFDMLGDIYSVPIDGGEATALTSEIAWNYQPRFSPDGSKIAFVSDRAGGDNLWIMNADGSEPYAVTDEAEHMVHNPAWSPDGEYLVGRKGFYSTRSISAGEIWMFHHGGGNGVNLVKRPHVENDQKNRSEPVFSADGKYVYYSADITPGKTWQYNKNSIGSVFAIQRLELASGETNTLNAETTDFSVKQVSARSGEFLNWSADSQAINWSHGRYLYRRDLNQAFAFLQGAPETLPEPADSGLDLAFVQQGGRPQGSTAWCHL